MPPAKSWRPLPLPPSTDLPVLLVSMDIDTAAYTVHITDLANMWTESLDRKAICIRGWSENTSIDPSDTPDNMAKFLTSLGTALDSSQPGHDQTCLQLTTASKSDAGDDSLTLNITCELPGLQPLKWPIHLKKLPPSAIATDLVLPLVQAHLTRTFEVESLVRMLSQKDAVLTKLLDKLEAMGTGLEHIFNPLSGKKKISRAAASDKVPGLASFERHRWKSDLAYADDVPSNTHSLVENVFGGEGLHFESTMEIAESPRLDQWWKDFRGASSTERRSHEGAAPSREKTPPPMEPEVGDDDDDFQVQSTPPHVSGSRKATVAASKPTADDASTEGGTESPSSTKDAPAASETPAESKPSRRLGTLGRKKQSTPPRSPSPVQRPKPQALSQKIDDSETASETEDDGAAASLPEDDPVVSSPPPSKPVAKKSGIGRIGGAKSKQLAAESSRSLESETSDNAARPVAHHPHKKLGVIGKTKEDDHDPALVTTEDRGRGRSAAKDNTSKTNPRETSQERADRRREELKRDLEKKAAAGPAKKKRRF
ncbi:hypothetical protein FZEAL_7581 [Fusarium zealandicum]|uniref:Non-homologous end-joining factor 1 n=1 Tax=Fusarium zealandicum TaxID=1053134 RepID=A0A8H4UFF7_9HYPO|nr:hypothetical protein FZEAL_7581 [Fusarium zealandicum]